MIPLARIAPIIFGEAGKPIFGGTAWCYQHNQIFVTAAHNLEDPDPSVTDPLLTAGHVWLADARTNEFIECDRLERHPSLDVAVLRTTTPTEFEPFTNVSEAAYAEPFYVCGFAAHLEPGPFAPRIMTGIVQRFFTHEFGQYPALELSVSTPNGMSGAPIFKTRDLHTIVGIVTGNIEAETVVDSYEEETTSGNMTRRTVKVTTFGVALRAASFKDFLDTTIREFTP